MNLLQPGSPGIYPKLIAGSALAAGLLLPLATPRSAPPGPSNRPAKDRQLIVLSAPSVTDPYYKKQFRKIIDFDVRFARAVLGRDNVVVLADEKTMPYFKGRLPADVLLRADVADIWIRDFGSVHPERMVGFVYDRPREKFIQKSFRKFVERYGLDIKRSRLKLDGGNVVDHAGDALILTEKIFDRNGSKSENQVYDALRKTLGAKHVAFIPMDEEYLGHADGMVMFLGPRTVLVNRYRSDPAFGAKVQQALRTELPGFEIREIDGEGYGEQHGRFASACGIFVNSAVTYKYIYTPIFGRPGDDRALRTIRSGTRKRVVPVPAADVCKLGGSVRCLSWQLTGENARKLIMAARED